MNARIQPQTVPGDGQAGRIAEQRQTTAHLERLHIDFDDLLATTAGDEAMRAVRMQGKVKRRLTHRDFTKNLARVQIKTHQRAAFFVQDQQRLAVRFDLEKHRGPLDRRFQFVGKAHGNHTGDEHGHQQ